MGTAAGQGGGVDRRGDAEEVHYLSPGAPTESQEGEGKRSGARERKALIHLTWMTALSRAGSVGSTAWTIVFFLLRIT